MTKHEDVQLICKYCLTKFSVHWNKRNQKCCSVSCSSKLRGSWSNHNKVNWSEVHKQAYRLGHNYVAGGTSKWYQYKSIKVQGSFELRVCKILDNWKANYLIRDWEYTNDRIQYIGPDNEVHNYLLDFKVININGSTYYIEVKGFETEIDKCKWKALSEQNIQFEVWKLQNIEEKEHGLRGC